MTLVRRGRVPSLIQADQMRGHRARFALKGGTQPVPQFGIRRQQQRLGFHQRPALPQGLAQQALHESRVPALSAVDAGQRLAGQRFRGCEFALLNAGPHQLAGKFP
jgi:hypothetical protein